MSIKKLQSNLSCSVHRKNEEIFLESNQVSSNSSLATLALSDTSLKIQSASEPLWKVVRFQKNQIHQLRQGEILKFGRVKFLVKELRTSHMPDPRFDRHVEVDTASNTCKICLSEQTEEENPLVSPCNCSGTMKYIHIECLKMCVTSQLTIKTSSKCVSYTWKSINCSLCGQPFPNSIIANNKKHAILLVSHPEPPYFILESLSSNSANRGMHSISLKNTESVLLGRGHDSDIRISDISVSRLHARIKFHKDNFYLEDYNSKFGTLVQVENTELKDLEAVSLQCGRSLLEFKLKNK